MLPRVHKRGTGFKGAVTYITHDPEAETTKRVGWAVSLNCGETEPADAWLPMARTWEQRTALKRAAGVDLRGRDNDKPVLHYTLSWRPGERPDAEALRTATLESLKALGLERHQAVAALHTDKDHWHLHVVVNTVHPETGKTADLYLSGRKLTQWAREWERTRAPELEKARESAGLEPDAGRSKEQRRDAMAKLRPQGAREAKTHRGRWEEREQVLNRMRRYRAEHEHRHMVERDVHWSRHRTERDELFRSRREATGIAVDYVRKRFKEPWRNLFKAQGAEMRHLAKIRTSPLDRAVFVYKNSLRLGRGRPLTGKEAGRLIASPDKLAAAVERVHGLERRELAMVQKHEMRRRLDRVAESYEHRLETLRTRQLGERAAVRTAQRAEADHAITWPRAQVEIMAERRGDIPPRQAPGRPPETDKQYVDRIKGEMSEFYVRTRAPTGPRSFPPTASAARCANGQSATAARTSSGTLSKSQSDPKKSSAVPQFSVNCVGWPKSATRGVPLPKTQRETTDADALQSNANPFPQTSSCRMRPDLPLAPSTCLRNQAPDGAVPAPIPEHVSCEIPSSSFKTPSPTSACFP